MPQAEFDTPRALLLEDGLFRAIVEESEDKDELYAMVHGVVNLTT